jgi:orotidine-5'-phosphate decarboxylase
MNQNPIIVALDVDSAEQALKLVDRLQGSVRFYKVGLELYAAAGIGIVGELIQRGNQVFLDLKLYDISETVKRAVAQISKSGATFLTVHGSTPVMRAAVEGRGSADLQLLAVTVLTNLDQRDINDEGYPCTVSELVALRTRNAMQAEVDGLICSAVEVGAVRELAGPEAIIVTPGVRSSGSAAGDQKRVATPAEAIRDGADYLVIGREITRATDPAKEVQRILGEIESSLDDAIAREAR